MSDTLSPNMSDSILNGQRIVRHFRQILLWPLQMEVDSIKVGAKPWEVLTHEGSPWRKLEPDIAQASVEAKERYYKEFVSFLPYVRRFLYGEGRSHHANVDALTSDSPMSVFRRGDVRGLRITLRAGDQPLLLEVSHVDLYLFFDSDVVFLNVEIEANDLPWDVTLELLHRFGRAYPSSWDSTGAGAHNAHRVEWLGQNGEVLAVSNSDNKTRFLNFVCEHRTPAIAAHWAYLLQPLVLEHDDQQGWVKYRQLEYHRMPVMAYLAVDNPRELSRDDFVRLAFITSFRPSDPIPWQDSSVDQFEARYCDDRHWTNTENGPNTRVMCTGNTLTVVGDVTSDYFCNEVFGVQAQFRRQFMLLFLIAHFHRAALLVFSDRMVDAVNDLDINDVHSQLFFRKRVRNGFESFLRFTHRYWFHELSERPQIQGLFQRSAQFLGNEEKYQDVKEEIRAMSQYLEGDSQRRQSNTLVRLGVVTTFGLIGTAATSFLGMNLLDLTASTLFEKIAYFVSIAIVSALLIFITVANARPLSLFLEHLAEGRFELKDTTKERKT